MKRHASSPTIPPSPTHKKPKNLASVSNDADSTEISEWTKVERRKHKKAKKVEVKQEINHPSFMYSRQHIARREHAISIDDIREFIIHLVADAPAPNWVQIKNANAIQRVVALLIPGLTNEMLALPPLPTSATSNPNIPITIPISTPESPSPLPFIASRFSAACPTRAPGDQTRMHSILSSFFSGPVSGEEKKKRIAQRLASERAQENDPSRYIISLEQMIENEYPVPSYMADVFEKPAGWAEVPEQSAQPLLTQAQQTKRKIYAIDCEMCLTENGKELTRVSMIDFYTGVKVYDSLVKPVRPITDYLTRWSGITETALENVTTTLTDVQSQVLGILCPPVPVQNPFSSSPNAAPPLPPPTPILLGHSLESDLKALKICHPFCIDTALIYHHPQGRPLKPGLAWLTKKWCGREIQNRGEGGHDPEEDATACIDLLKKKLENGPGFGEFKTDYESIFERIRRSSKRSGPTGEVKCAVVDHGNPSFMHGSKAHTSIGCTLDEQVLKGLLDVLPTHQFAFGRFMGLAHALGWTTPKGENNSNTNAANAPPPAIPPPIPELPPSSILDPVLSTLNDQLTTLYEFLPPRTALVIFTGHSDPRRMAALNARKSYFESALRSGKKLEDIPKEGHFSSQESRDLEEAVVFARRGLLFMLMKN